MGYLWTPLRLPQQQRQGRSLPGQTPVPTKAQGTGQEALPGAQELSRAGGTQGPTCSRCSVTGMAFSSRSRSMAPSWKEKGTFTNGFKVLVG